MSFHDVGYPYSTRAVIDGQEQIFRAKNYSEAMKIRNDIETELLFSKHSLGSIKIFRENDQHLMYDNKHEYPLLRYEEYSEDQWKETTFAYARISSKPSVYIDIDGTLAYWYRDGKGLKYPEEILDPSYHYYRDLEPHAFLVDLAEELVNKNVDVCILSATDRSCFLDRWEWINKNLPFIPKENIFLCPIGSDKSNFCKGNAKISILIDDYEPNLRHWEGEGIKSVNSINSLSEIFKNIPTAEMEQLKKTDKEYIRIKNEWVDAILLELDSLPDKEAGIRVVDITTNYSDGKGLVAKIKLPIEEMNYIRNSTINIGGSRKELDLNDAILVNIGEDNLLDPYVNVWMYRGGDEPEYYSVDIGWSLTKRTLEEIAGTLSQKLSKSGKPRKLYYREDYTKFIAEKKNIPSEFPGQGNG